MDETTKRVAEGLKKAMQAEHEGRHFYLMASESTKDPKGQQTFKELAEEELDHFNYLKRHYESVVKTGQIDSTARLGEQKVLTGMHPIFSDDIQKRVKDAHYEMTALSIGVQLEMSAIQFYRAEAEAATDPGVKELHQELAKWEQGHLSALEQEIEALKEDYWHDAGFAPF